MMLKRRCSSPDEIAFPIWFSFAARLSGEPIITLAVAYPNLFETGVFLFLSSSFLFDLN
jgi:hypothetical protein